MTLSGQASKKWLRVSSFVGGALVLALAVGAVETLWSGQAEAARAPQGGASYSRVQADKVEKENFVVSLVQQGDIVAGKEGIIELRLYPKGEYHLNAQYPFKLKLGAASEGVTYPKTELTRADGTWEEHKGSLPIKLTPSKAGKIKVGGRFALSVCSDRNCVMEKVDLELDVDVK